VPRFSSAEDPVNKKRARRRNKPGHPLHFFEELLEEYRRSLQAANRSPKTISSYFEVLPRFFRFLDAQGPFKGLAALGPRDLEAYILHLQTVDRWDAHLLIPNKSGGLSPHTINVHVRTVKACWSWLHRNGYLDSNPLEGFHLPKAPDKPFSTLSEGQICQLLGAIDRLTPKGARLYLMILMLTDGGLRVSELVQIQISHLDLTHGFIQVVGKGGKLRPIPVSQVIGKAILRYMTNHRPQLCSVDSPHLFPDDFGAHVSVDSVQQGLRRLGMRSGLKDARCSPHTFRHTFATEFAANGGNAFALQAIMGHASISTTLRYTHLKPHDLQRQHSQYSPIAKFDLPGIQREGSPRKRHPP